VIKYNCNDIQAIVQSILNKKVSVLPVGNHHLNRNLVHYIKADDEAPMTVIAEKELQDNGVQLVLGDGVKAFDEKGGKIEVILNSDKKLVGDLIILAIGVAPDTAFLKDTGIELGARGHIVVNNKMETNIEGIFACGNVVYVHDLVDFVTKESRIAGKNAALYAKL